MINDKSQDSTAKHLRLDEQLPLKCIIQCAGKRIFKIGEHLAKLQAKNVRSSHTPHSVYTFVVKDAELAR